LDHHVGSAPSALTASEKVRMVEKTFETGMTVSLVARRHGVAPNQLFTWRRLVAQGSLTAAGSGQEVVPASDYQALQNQVRELHRLLGKKTATMSASVRDQMPKPQCVSCQLGSLTLERGKTLTVSGGYNTSFV
jgi:transposase-like protein